jgi:hypothetical protein
MVLQFSWSVNQKVLETTAISSNTDDDDNTVHSLTCLTTAEKPVTGKHKNKKKMQ